MLLLLPFEPSSEDELHLRAQLFAKLTVQAQTWLGFAMLGAATLATGLFACVFLMAKRHGSRGGRPATFGYELARTDEMSQELLEDDDEDFEEVVIRQCRRGSGWGGHCLCCLSLWM